MDLDDGRGEIVELLSASDLRLPVTLPGSTQLHDPRSVSLRFTVSSWFTHALRLSSDVSNVSECDRQHPRRAPSRSAVEAAGSLSSSSLRRRHSLSQLRLRVRSATCSNGIRLGGGSA